MKTSTKIFSLVLFALLTGGNVFSQNWNLVWSDEFTNGISSDWVFETGTGGGGWGNNELEYYRRENASVQNGQLVLTAKRESFGGMNYTSVRMKTQGKKSWKYGKIEARIAVPSFTGAWPAFWMLGDNISSVGWPKCGEIDIMEHINTGNAEYGTIHWADAGGAHVQYSNSTNVNGITGYHTYAVEWDANLIKWYVDGVQFAAANIQNNINSTEEFHNNFFILLNFAIGGNWPGFAVDNNAFPANMYVDYVRVYQAGSTPPPSGVATVYKDCNYGGYAIGLPAGDYNYGALYAKGVGNEDISSLKINGGYEVQLFENDDFTGSSITYNGDVSCLVGDGWNDRTTSLKIRAAGTSFTRTIQAENYSAMAGVQVEGTTDAGGGSNVGYIETGDWMAYNSINFPSSGTYKVEYRVASLNGGGKISLDLNAGSIQLGAVNVPSTGGWQNWTTVSHTVNVNAGTYNVGVYAAAGGFNINWFRITKVSGARTAADDALASATTLSEDEVQLYPNPVNNEINLQTVYDLQDATAKVFNSLGVQVLSVSGDLTTIDMSKLDAGIYTLQILTKDNQKIFKKFVKN